MRRLAVFSVVAIFLVSSGYAQEVFPRAEVLGAYSYFRTDTTLPSAGPSLGDLIGTTHLNGWNAAIAGNLTPWLGVVGDFSGHYGSPSVGGFSLPVGDNSLYLFLFGPQLSYRHSNFITPFAHALIGDARLTTNFEGFSVSDNALAAALGGGVDLNLSRSLAVRAVQADYVMTRFGDERQNNLRLSFGLVLRLGH